jgi:peptide/nickel transport system permease protein
MMGNLMLSSVMVILGSLIADVLYAVADPRIKY